MWDQLLLITVPFLTAFLNVLSVALAIGMLPAMWILGRNRQFRSLWRWGIVAAIFITAAVYALPLAHVEWKRVTQKGFKPVAMYLGYFVGLMFAPMVLPEPFRIAQRRIRNERERPKEPELRVRRVRHKRRKEGFSGDFKLR